MSAPKSGGKRKLAVLTNDELPQASLAQASSTVVPQSPALYQQQTTTSRMVKAQTKENFQQAFEKSNEILQDLLYVTLLLQSNKANQSQAAAQISAARCKESERNKLFSE